MSTKAETVMQAIQGLGCLGKAQHDEPVFVLRAQDKLSPNLVRQWAEAAAVQLEERRLLITTPEYNSSRSKIAEAYELAAEMEAWQMNNRSKYPD